MRSFHNDGQLKWELVSRLKQLREAGQIINAQHDGPADKWCGDAVRSTLYALGLVQGRTLDTADSGLYVSELGLPTWLADLETLHSNHTPWDYAQSIPERIITSIPVGVELEAVRGQYLAFLMESNIGRVDGLDIAKDFKNEVINAIWPLMEIHKGERDGSAAVMASFVARAIAEAAKQPPGIKASGAVAAHAVAVEAAWSAVVSIDDINMASSLAAHSAGYLGLVTVKPGSERSTWKAARTAGYQQQMDALIELLKAAR